MGCNARQLLTANMVKGLNTNKAQALEEPEHLDLSLFRVGLAMVANVGALR